MAESSLDGDVDLDFIPAGLRWHAVCHASSMLDKSPHWSEDNKDTTRL
jgi:hypothetical protein